MLERRERPGPQEQRGIQVLRELQVRPVQREILVLQEPLVLLAQQAQLELPGLPVRQVIKVFKEWRVRQELQVLLVPQALREILV
jgi:hypothetical protein